MKAETQPLSGRILAIDDEPNNLDIIKELFSESDFIVDTAENGEEGLRLASEIEPDIILLDNMMPGLSGIDVCKALRSDEKYKLTKVLLVSAKGMVSERLEGYHSGANDYIVKPFNLDELEAKVQVFAQLAAAEKKIEKYSESLEHEIEQYKEQLLQAEKLASIGQLSAGIAHEINNPIGFVSSNISTLNDYVKVFKDVISKYQDLLSNLPSDLPSELSEAISEVKAYEESEDVNFLLDDVQEIMSESLDGIDRVKDIVHGLKSFARSDDAKIEEVDLNTEIENSIKLIWSELKHTCKIERHFGEIEKIKCLPKQLSQVFMNLMTNASHAVETGGIITITTEQEGSNIILKFSDNGCGIDDETKRRIFDPFYTTKEVGKGTGLGLATSYGIITNHGGAINVESEIGSGTTFQITLPINNMNEESND